MEAAWSFKELVSTDRQQLVSEHMHFLSAQQPTREAWLSQMSQLLVPRARTPENAPLVAMRAARQDLTRVRATQPEVVRQQVQQPFVETDGMASFNVTQPPSTQACSNARQPTEPEGPSSPLVSIIIPTYNDGDFVRSAVRTALEQDYPNLEIIVVDDGSTDNTREQLEAFLEDERVRYLYQENRGLGAARNRGIAESRGEYLNFLDADDYLHPSKIAKQVPVLESEPSVDLVYCDVTLVDRNGQPIDDYSVGASRKILDGDIFDSLMLGGYFPLHVVLLRRRVLDQVGVFDEELRATEDLDLWLRASAEGFQSRYLDEKLAYYRRYAGTISQDEAGMRLAHAAVLDKMARKYPARIGRAFLQLIKLNEELHAGNQWLAGQRANWQRAAEEREEMIRQEEAEIAALKALVAGYESGRVMRMLKRAAEIQGRVSRWAHRRVD